MSSAKVSLVIRVKLSDGSRRYCPPVTTQNGKLKPFYAEVDGKTEHHPEGAYALRYRNQGRLFYESLGSDPAEVLIAQKKKEAYLQAAAVGLMIPEVSSQTHPFSTVANLGTFRPLQETIVEYLEEIKAHKSRATDRHYTLTLTLFLESCKKQHLEELDRKDVLAFMSYLRVKGNAPRTVANRVGFLKTFMLSQGLKWPLLKSDKPRYTDKVVGAYDQQEIRALLAANQDEYELIQFFLCTGARNKEVEFATWSDINFFDKTFTVKEKLDLGFTPKDKEEGAIPIPDSLVTLLRTRRKRHPSSRMIFPGPGGTPNNHFLRILKRLALRAGLNCGQCYNKHGLCCAEHPVCSHWELHRLRKTYATMHHEAGVPVRTIQRWLRHSDLETTLRYLAGSDDKSERTRQQVNATFAGLAGPYALPA